MKDWQAYYKELTILVGGSKPVRKPTIAQLNRFERESGFRLPESYRQYIVAFGPGRLFHDWDIAAPGYSDFPTKRDLARLNSDYRPGARSLESGLLPESEVPRLARCFYFCSKYKDLFGWDPEEVCDEVKHEYAVYRLTECHRVLRVADSFAGFIEAASNEIRNSNWDDEELGTRWAFEPATVAEKKS